MKDLISINAPMDRYNDLEYAFDINAKPTGFPLILKTMGRSFDEMYNNATVYEEDEEGREHFLGHPQDLKPEWNAKAELMIEMAIDEELGGNQ